MKIASVESFIVHAPIPRFVADSFNTATTWGLPGVIVRTKDGVEGWGYTSTLSFGDRAIKSIIDDIYTPLLIGENPMDTQRLWEKLYWSDSHWVGRSGIAHMAIAAVDIALWDLKCKLLGQPLYKLIGGHKPGAIKSYNTDGGWLNFGVPRLVDEMQALLEQGYVGVKMKIGGPDPRVDVARVGAVRKALGDNVDLMIDVNQKWDRTTALGWAPRFEEFAPGWLEEPLDPDDVEGHALLAKATRIPIALGEHVYTRTQFREFIGRAGIGYAQVDCTRVAGITEWLAVAEIALAHHVPVVPHHADMMRVHQHLGAGHAASPMIECIPWLQELFQEPADIRNGVFNVPDTPGASTTFDRPMFEKHRVA
ncbi:mandelate racemase/muconate lactonizing enzyme family protein [Mesorhizobium sp. LNJC405B00]|uniref:mandelate racemase/muconate lactonizing enzyme family protein n=1 Tax=Mesorhizobium sp. LNJC405B00 TaxID=1287281 RepID=UPI0004CDE343|nr:mandelate racemase/muconate lactonizing enzyme family protein [Mesorhizobium sp. LNJC405B00]